MSFQTSLWKNSLPFPSPAVCKTSLAELVKIDPKSIGVGQYQHDVNQKSLSESLDFVVDTVVNQVGVNVNTASPALLAHVAGLNKTISENIVKYREENGALTSRQQLKRFHVWVTRPLSRQLVSCGFLMRLTFGQYWRAP